MNLIPRKEPMKLKLMILSALFAAGAFASFALANDGKHARKADCRNVHLSGTIAPQTLAVTVDKASQTSGIAAGSQVSLAIGSAGQTVRLNAEACSTGTGAALVLTVKQVELRVKAATTTSTTGTTETTTTHGDQQGQDGHGEKDGKHREGGTTTTGTTTTGTITVGTTTTGATTTTATTGTTTTHAGTTTTTP
jgi:hypothetical protein